jgi:hypothetical protein
MIDQPLQLYMGHCLELQGPLLGVGRIVAMSQCAFDITGVSIVPLDKVGIAAVHRAHKIANAEPYKLR